MTNLCAYSYPAPLMRTNIRFCLISNLNKFFLFYRINYLLSDPVPDDPNDNGYTTLISIISSIHYLKRNHSATSILHNYFLIDRRGKSINHFSVFSSTVSGTTIHHLNQGCGSAFTFCGSGSSGFSDCGSGSNCLKMKIRIQLKKFC